MIKNHRSFHSGPTSSNTTLIDRSSRYLVCLGVSNIEKRDNKLVINTLPRDPPSTASRPWKCGTTVRGSLYPTDRSGDGRLVPGKNTSPPSWNEPPPSRHHTTGINQPVHRWPTWPSLQNHKKKKKQSLIEGPKNNPSACIWGRLERCKGARCPIL